jgi:hypothetical protein
MDHFSYEATRSVESARKSEGDLFIPGWFARARPKEGAKRQEDGGGGGVK